jgi:hypothetical protein
MRPLAREVAVVDETHEAAPMGNPALMLPIWDICDLPFLKVLRELASASHARRRETAGALPRSIGAIAASAQYVWRAKAERRSRDSATAAMTVIPQLASGL